MISSASKHEAPLVSIITPVYNHERYVGSCIESVLAQTYANWEQIVIDDGSTDRTRQIIEEYSDIRIRYIGQPNQGIEALARTYNRALSASNGSLVAILEGDDTWPPDKLSRMVPVFQDPEIVLAFGEGQDLDATGRLARRQLRSHRRRRHLPRPILFNDPVRSATAHLLSADGQSLITTSTVLLRREALERIGGFQCVSGKCPTDVPTFVRLSLIGKFHYSPELLGYRRRHVYSATLRFLDTMPNTARRSLLSMSQDSSFGLTLEERQFVEESWRLVPLRVECTQGRMNLLQGQWQEARPHFVNAMRTGEPRLILLAAAGWTLSWAHLNLEGIYKLAGRTSLR